MPTLHQYATEIVRKLPGEVGTELWREEAIASLTTTTIVSNALAVGGLSNDAYASRWLWRPDTATTADKERYCTLYTSSSGTLTHAGTNFADTTATGENVIISKLRPGVIRAAIDSAIRRLRVIDRTEVPFVQGQGWYSLGDLDWIRQPSDIVRIAYNSSPVITRNRNFQKHSSVNSSGLFLPDWWTIASNNAAAPYLATNYRGLKYYYSLERSGGTDATMTQAVSALRSGVSGDSPSGETVVAVCTFDPGTAGDVLLSITDGTTTATSTGSGAALQEATASITLNSAATDVTLTVTAQTSNAAQKIYDAYAVVGSVDDMVRRDNYPEYELQRKDWDFDQNGVLTIKLPQVGRGQFLIYSKRSYPGFDSTRLISGAADADSSEAPIDAVVAGALAVLSRSYPIPLPDPYRPDHTWEAEFSQLSRRHSYNFANSLNPKFNFPITPGVRRLR